MNRFRLKNVIWVLPFLISLLLSDGWAATEYIDINNPFYRKIPIAVPYFKAQSEDQNTRQLSRKSSQLLADTLKFTGFFKILDPAGFLENPQKTGITPPYVQFKNWTAVGAELLITGGLRFGDDIMQMELRLYDTFKSRLVVGKRYRGLIKDQRKIIRRFCNEVIYALTGKQGIFASKIGFVSNGSGNKEIYTCDFDGFNPKQITRNKTITLSPAWSSDGKWFAYTSYIRGKPDLFIRNIKGKRGTVVAKEGLNITPAWVPGESNLAATLSFSGDQEIYLLTKTGKIIKRLTHSPGIDVSPAWSPDGKKMAFVSKRSGTPQIYVKHMDSGRVERVTFYGRHNTQPAWSPKGDRIAYTALEKGKTNIYTVTVKGKNPVQLTYRAGDNETPTWSPDGNLIAFSTTREGLSRIYVMTAFGTDKRRLLTLPGEQTNPKWSPRLVND